MIFDTNIFIYADRGYPSAKELLLQEGVRCISAVTYMEYVPFCRNKKELKIFENLLTALNFQILEINAEISILARQYVKDFALSHGVEMGDALIAATARQTGLALCTSNVKHFKHFKHIEIVKFAPL